MKSDTTAPTPWRVEIVPSRTFITDANGRRIAYILIANDEDATAERIVASVNKAASQSSEDGK